MYCISQSHFNMQVVNAKKTSSLLTVFKIMFKTWKLLVKSKSKDAGKKARTRQKNILEDQGICGTSCPHPDFFNVDSERNSQCETAIQHNQVSALCFEERVINRTISSPWDRVEEQLIYRRWVDVSTSDARSKSWFDLYQEQHLQQSISFHLKQFEVLADESETRIVDGLLTTTLCSTEL